MVHTILIVLCFCSVFIFANNFTEFNDDVLLWIQKYLPIKERPQNFRVINTKCNNVFETINTAVIDDLNELQSLLNQLERRPFADDRTAQIIDKIGKIHRTHWLNEQYLLIMPKIISKWYHIMRNEPNYSKKMELVDELVLELNEGKSTINYTAFKELDDVTKELIFLSREIAISLVFGNDTSTNYARLMYQQCWEYLSSQNSSLLPPFQSIYYLADNSDIYPKQFAYLNHLMLDFGLVLVHQSYLDSKWNDVDIESYLEHHYNIMMVVENWGIGNHKDLEFIFDAKFLITILQNIDSTHLQNFIASESEAVVGFVEFLQNVIYYLSGVNSDGMLVRLLFQLKRNDGLKLLRWNNFLVTGLDTVNDTNGCIKLTSTLCSVILTEEDRNDVIQQRSVIIAKSAYYWRTKDYQKSMETIAELSREPLFSPLLLKKIIQIHNELRLVVNRRYYISYVMLNLLGKRSDWDLTDNLSAHIPLS